MAFRTRWVGGSVTMMVLIGILMAIAADGLFYRQPIGWTPGLYVMLWATAVLLKRPGRAAAGLWFLLLGLAVSMAIEPNFWNIALAIVGLASLATVSRKGWITRIRIWLISWAQFAFGPLLVPLVDMNLMRRWQSRHPGSASRWGGRLVPWLLPLVLGAVFVTLFTVANPIISDTLSSLRQWAVDQLKIIALPRMFIWAVALLGTWTLLRHRLKLPRNITTPQTLGTWRESTLDWLFSPGVVLRCLILFNLIFAVQTCLDLRYLWGGAALPDGMIYATYARRGAYPLVATALLAGAFVMITFRSGGAAEKLPIARQLVYLWIAQNLLLLSAAAWRLSIYIEVYSLSRWRFAAGIWMGMVVLGFALIITRIIAHRSNAWLGRSNALFLLVVLYGCSFVNFDGIIASYNADHCVEVLGEGVPIDFEYLEALGIESIPVLRKLETRFAEQPLGQQASTLAHQLTEQLHKDTNNWRGLTWRRARLLAE